MAEFACKFQDSADEPALGRLAGRLAQTAYASWPLQCKRTGDLPGAPEHDSFVVRRRRLLVCRDAEVRALQNFFEHEIYVDGQPHRFVWPNGALSEGIVERRYAGCGLMAFLHGLKLQPLQMGMGASPAMQRIATRLGWKRTTNFGRFLLPLRPANVLCQMAWFQRTPARRLTSHLLAWSGLGTLLSYALSGRKGKRFRTGEYRAELCDHFGPWADDLWREVMPSYVAVTRRDAATMNRLYRPRDARFRRTLVLHNNRPVGWFLFTTCLRRTSDLDLGFGGLRVGALVDTFCSLEHARPLLALAVEQMVREGVDLIFGHWTHQGWGQALRDVGFQRTQAFPFFVSPAGSGLLFTPARPVDACHFTDGDCDGPYYVQAEAEQRLERAA
jgi:hypothetical protein